MTTTDTPRTDALVWRNLERCEIIQDGDEVLSSKGWIKARRIGQPPFSQSIYRTRRIALEADPIELQAEVEFWKAKAYEAEFYEAKHKAEVERLNEQLESTKQLALKFWKVLEENGFKLELPK